jgi:hypothetical protein
MPTTPATSDIHGKTGDTFSILIDSGLVQSAYLEVDNQPIVSLVIDTTTERQITVPSLPSGTSYVRLDIVWAPDNEDASIDVAPGAPATVGAANPKHTLQAGNTPGYVEIYGA